MAVILFPGVSSQAFPFPAPAPADPLQPKRRKRGASQKADQRLGMLAKIHIALDDLYARLKGFNEDVYRYTLRERFGEESAAALDNDQLHQVLAWLSSLGWAAQKPRRRKDAPAALGAVSRLEKIEALLAEKGRVERTDMPWSYAMGILKRQTGGEVRSFDKASDEELDAVIAALYRDAKRKGRRVR